MNLISVLPYLYEYLSQVDEAVPVNTPLAFINWPLNLLFCRNRKSVILDFIKKWFIKEENNLDFYSFPVGTDECSKSSDWKEADVSLDHLSLLCEGPGRETAFASKPSSNKTLWLGNQSCQRCNSLSDSSVASRQLKMNSELRAAGDLEGENSLCSGRESRCGGSFIFFFFVFFFLLLEGEKNQLSGPLFPHYFY